MIGITVEIAINWLLLWLFNKKHPTVLGILPTAKRSRQFVLGFFLTALFSAFVIYLQTVFSGSQWKLNENFTFLEGLNSLWWHIKSVAFEELIFRGALLYLALRKLGEWKACLLSAFCFGIYHWFSMGAVGNAQQMIFIFINTFSWGMMFAYALSRTGALYLPIGLHLGWNLTNTSVFSQGALGNQLLIPFDGSPIGGLPSLFIWILPIVGAPVVIYFYLRNRKAAFSKLTKISDS